MLIMASGPITSWQIDGETVETGQTLFWGIPKSLQMLTVAMKLRHLLLGRKVMPNLDSILKSRDITLMTKVHLVKAMIFPVVIYGCESWTIRKAECRRTDAFELWCWRRLLRVPSTARRCNQSILKEIGPEYSLEGLMLKLKLILWPPDSKKWLIWKDPDAGKDGRWEKKGMPEDEMVGWLHWLNGHEFEKTPGVGDGEESLVCFSPWDCRKLDMTECLNWTELNWMLSQLSYFSSRMHFLSAFFKE